MTQAGHILLVEDMRHQAALCPLALREHSYNVIQAGSVDAALAALDRDTPDAVLLDLKLPDGSGLSLLRVIRRRMPDLPVIVMAPDGSVPAAVQAMRAGAADFLLKPLAAERLLTTLDHALERARLKRDLRALTAAQGRDAFCGFVGAAPAMQAVYRILENAAASNATVFLQGESGTGKELAAAAIHRLSPRRDGPFVAVNCAATPQGMQESAIFGHVQGAFASARQDRAGAAEQADGGTLFLDEIGQLDLAVQGKLLRLVQTGAFQPQGAAHTRHAELRILCSTNRDLRQQVASGAFREDLFYRLHVLPITLPPLRERGGDVMVIADHFLSRFTQDEEKHFSGFAPDAEALLRAHAWPGNVRELENAIRTAVVLHDGPEVTAAMLPMTVGRAAKPTRAIRPSQDPSLRIRPLAVLEREAIEVALQACRGNAVRAAALLGIRPAELNRRRAALRAASA